MKKILILSTGGTIQMKKVSNGIVPFYKLDELIDSIQNLFPELIIETEEFSNIPSPWITVIEMMMIKKKIEQIKKKYIGIIITHGTDTLEETAFFLSITLDDNFPVIMTAAMRAQPDLGIDGPRNIYDSIKVILSEQCKNLGVLVVMNNEIFLPRDITKISTTNVAAFSSPEYGHIGVVDDRVIIYNKKIKNNKIFGDKVETKVDLIKAVSGCDSRLIISSIESGVKGIIIEALGRGNVPKKMLPGIKLAIEKNIPVIITTQVLHGRVSPIYAYEGGGKYLAGLGCFFADDLNSSKARLKLMLVLGNYSKENIRRYFKYYEN